MRLLSNVKIRVKLVGAFSVVLTAGLGLGFFAIDSADRKPIAHNGTVPL